MEEWKVIPNTNNKLFISNMGSVKSVLRDDPRILKCQKDQKGYLRVTFSIDGNKKTYKLHRLVAQAFIDNPNNKPQVNHIDGNKLNNNVSNLEWVSNKENAHHAMKAGLWDSVIEGAKIENNNRKKKVAATREETIYFDSVREAERYFNSRHISDVLKGKRKHVKGWSFSYVEGGDLKHE